LHKSSASAEKKKKNTIVISYWGYSLCKLLRSVLNNLRLKSLTCYPTDIMSGFNFLEENRNILICWSFMPCCAFYLCNANSHQIIKTADYFRLHWKSRIKLNCGPAEDSALLFPSKSFEISVFFGFKTVKVFWIQITRQLPCILAVYILAYFQ